MDRERAKDYITGHEGRRNRAYPDGEGILTIGIGMNLMEERNIERITDAGLDYAEICNGTSELDEDDIDAFFSEDLEIAAMDAVGSLEDFWNLPDDVQLALVDMSFQLGGPRLRKFRNMIEALNSTPPNYMKAADEIADSLYARQTPNRAADNIMLVRGCAL